VRCAALAAALGAGLAAQDVRRAHAIDETRWREHGLATTLREGSAGVASVSWQRPGRIDTIPLTPPRERVAFARLSDDVLVVLAGGVRDPLDVYVWRANGELRRVATGGHQLPATFGGGLGSWPIAVGRDVFVFAFQKDERCELRAVGFGSQVYLSRSLPRTVDGFQVRYQPGAADVEVEVSAGAEREVHRFPHPAAPRLHVDHGLLDFDTVALGSEAGAQARVTNPGAAAMPLALTVDGAGFVLAAGPAAVPAGGEATVQVTFAPAVAGPAQGTLTIASPQLERPLTVVLRGRGEPAAAVQPASPPGDAQPRPAVPTPVPTPVEGGGPTRPEPRRPSLPAPMLAAADGTVRVGGVPGETLLVALVAMDGERPMRSLAVWRVRLPASDGRLVLPARLFGAADQPVHLVALRRNGTRLQESAVLTVDADQR
jgi:hypothetical protein